MEEKSEAKSEVAEKKPRDEKGHFIKQNISVSKTSNDEKLVNLQVSNPLTRITKLLEDIKKQKAFAFTIKGSLGILGVAVALSVFGFFGGSKMLCDKGTQTEIGIVKVLKLQEIEPSGIPLIGEVYDYYKNMFWPVDPKRLHDRVVLVTNQNQTIYLPYNKEVKMGMYNNMMLYVTGRYDSCSQTLKVEDPNGVQLFN